MQYIFSYNSPRISRHSIHHIRYHHRHHRNSHIYRLERYIWPFLLEIHTNRCCKHHEYRWYHNCRRRRSHRIHHMDLFYFWFNFVLVFHYAHAHIYTNKNQKQDNHPIFGFLFFFCCCVCVCVCVCLIVYYHYFLVSVLPIEQQNAIFSYYNFPRLLLLIVDPSLNV